MLRRSLGPMLALVAIVALLVSACGGSDSEVATATIAPPVATQAPTEQPTESAVDSATATTPAESSATVPVAEAATATIEPTATAEESEAPANPTTPISADLEKALIKLSDLPTGWTADTSIDDSSDDEPGVCNMLSINAEHPAARKAEASFTGGQLGPFLNQLIAEYNDDEAEIAIQSGRDAIACGSWTDGDGVEWTINEMSFPDVGDEKIAIKVTGTSDGFAITAEMIVIRDGNKLISVTHSGLGSVDSSLTEQVVRTSLDRLN